ncbi:unnamed protein product [Prorocentrum cordatum]|uniref:Secreted protein n=1 Tax=Prorocentrum cordatum TaxID=2364126 RepID=A0ABN9RHW1_9DINO|nr:unnamed protein product [Polarella glacialis]
MNFLLTLAALHCSALQSAPAQAYTAAWCAERSRTGLHGRLVCVFGNSIMSSEAQWHRRTQRRRRKEKGEEDRGKTATSEAGENEFLLVSPAGQSAPAAGGEPSHAHTKRLQ